MVLDEAISVVSSANFRNLTEGSLDMQFWCGGRIAVGKNTAPRSSNADGAGAG